MNMLRSESAGSADEPVIRVVLADDHPIVRDGLRGMCASAADLEVVGEAATGDEAVTLALALQPDVVLMDLRMPGGNGVQATRQICAAERGVRVLVLTTFDTDDEVMAALDAGATGYLLKDAPRQDLFAAIRSVAGGDQVLSAAVVDRAEGRSPGQQLTAREVEVLRLVSKGLSNRDIASELFVSQATVKTHLSHVYDKLGAPDRAAAVAIALGRGLFDPAG